MFTSPAAAEEPGQLIPEFSPISCPLRFPNAIARVQVGQLGHPRTNLRLAHPTHSVSAESEPMSQSRACCPLASVLLAVLFLVPATARAEQKAGIAIVTAATAKLMRGTAVLGQVKRGDRFRMSEVSSPATICTASD